ncbi:MAG: aspartate-semialdehyde dehydrogenase [bacterium]
MSKQYKVGIVGATGAVGQEMIRMLERRKFPVDTIKLLASERSRGRKLFYQGKQYPVEVLNKNSWQGLDIALFSAGADRSKEFAPIFAKNGCFVIDNSSAFRLDEDIPLVVPEVNPESLEKSKKLIANPNCSTIQMVVALKPIHYKSRIKRIIVSTYQAVSGAGAKAVSELKSQAQAFGLGKPYHNPEKFPYRIAFNCIPHIDMFLDNGYTKEEMKMVNETRKIMNAPDIAVSATAVRVPVFRSHAESIWIETEDKISAGQARELLRKAPGIIVEDDLSKNLYPLQINAEDRYETFVGRIREDISCPNGLVMWVVSDNLLKGAALNAVQIAELLIQKKFI